MCRPSPAKVHVVGNASFSKGIYAEDDGTPHARGGSESLRFQPGGVDANYFGGRDVSGLSEACALMVDSSA